MIKINVIYIRNLKQVLNHGKVHRVINLIKMLGLSILE